MRLPNGYGSVVKLGGNRRKPYAARVTVGWTENHETRKARQRYKYLGYFESRPEALAALADYNRDPSSVANQSITLAEVYAAWSARKLEGASNATVRSHASAWSHMAAFHHRDIKTISTDAMQALLDELSLKYSESTVRNVRRSFIESFKWAAQRDIVSKNYAEFLKVKRFEKSEKHRPFTDAEVQRVLALADAGDEGARLAAIMLYTGVRIAELINQPTKNIDLEARMMIGGVKTSAGKNRRIPLHERIVPYLEERMGGRYLVMNVSGTAPAARTVFLSNYWRPLMDEIGAEHLPHDTRSTFVSKLDSLGANEVAVKMIVGHSFGGDVTKKAYTFKTDEELLAAVDLLDW